MKRALAVAAILGLCSAGCTSSNPASASPFTVQVSGTAEPTIRIRQDIASPHNGMLTVALSWANPAVDLDLYLTTATCTDPFSTSSTCVKIASSDGTSMPERVNATVTTGAPQLTAWLINWGSVSQPYTLTINVN
jgi:hypothetical protein